MSLLETLMEMGKQIFISIGKHQVEIAFISATETAHLPNI